MSKDDKKTSSVMSDIKDWLQSKSKKTNKNETPKYALSEDPKDIKYITSNDYWDATSERCILKRIVALKDIVDDKGNVIVHKGDRGGFVESLDNLSQEGTCWIYDDTCVYNGANVSDNAQLYGKVEVFNFSSILGNVTLKGKVKVKRSKISEDAKVFDNVNLINSNVYGKANIHGFATLIESEAFDEVEIFDHATLEKTKAYEKSKIFGKAKTERAELFGNTKVYGNSVLYERTKAYGNSEIFGNANIIESDVFGNAKIFGLARVLKSKIFDDARLFGLAWVHSANVFGKANLYGKANLLSQRTVDRNPEAYSDAVLYNGDDNSAYITTDELNIITSKNVCGNANIFKPVIIPIANMEKFKTKSYTPESTEA